MALLSTLVDNFNTAGAISSQWTFTNLGLSGSASCAGGTLVLNAGTTTAYNGESIVYSTASYDLEDSGAYVKLVDASSDPTRTITIFQVEDSSDPTDNAVFQIDETGTLYYLFNVDGSAVAGGSVTYDPAVHTYFRIHEVSGTVFMDCAPATATNPPIEADWVNMTSRAVVSLGWNSGNVNSVKSVLRLRLTGVGAASPPTAEFDGFNTVAGSLTDISATFAAQEAATADTFSASLFDADNAPIQVTAALTETGSDTFAASATIGELIPTYSPPADDDAYIAWLKKSDSVKVLLVEVDVLDLDGLPVTLRMSNMGYVTSPTDLPPNTNYSSDIIGGCTVESEISLEYTHELSLGDVEVSNVNGVHDDWFNYIWKNRPIRFYHGDMRWLRPDFRLVFSGTTQQLTSRDYNKLNIVLSDKLQRLNQSVSSELLGGLTENADKLIPLCFGECSNITPLLTNPATLEYQVHDGVIEDIVEVRDEGIPVGFTKDLAAGKFYLTSTPAGRVTATVQGDKFGGVYATTLPQIIRRLVTGFGTQPFTTVDIDEDNFTDYESNQFHKLGIYLQSRENILDVCNVLAASVGAAVTQDGLGKLRLQRMGLIADEITQYVNPSNFQAKTFEIFENLDPQPAFKLGYCRNWTPQPDLQSGIPEAHKALWADAWLTVTQADSAQCTLYAMPEQPKEQVDTYMIQKYDVTNELTRRLGIWAFPHTIYGFVGFAELIGQELGQWINITHDRFGFDNGVNAYVLGFEKDFYNFKINMKVFV